MNAKIIITGDVHHNLGTGHHRAGFDKEHIYAKEYLEILRGLGLKSTLFVTGKQIEERIRFWQRIAREFDVEIGGHTYSAMDWYPPGLGIMFKNLFNATYGPRFVQERDINLCERAFKYASLHLSSWRTHEYQSNDITRQILMRKGLKIISDNVRVGGRIRFDSLHGRFVELPINILPDHENLNHGSLRGMDSHDYKRKVLEQVSRLAESDSVVVLLLHPVCMKVLDGFKIFKEICSALKRYRTMQCRDI